MSEVWAERIASLYDMMQRCTLCPRRCGVDRLKGESGVCGIGADAVVSSYGPHFGEESVLVGRCGSGTIFFAGCNLKCVFCQNYDISHLRRGGVVTTGELAGMMLRLAERGCHNINLVTPTHQVARIAEALSIARGMGLEVPVVYNCGGYESVDVLKLLEGFVDIYMPDIKYGDNEPGKKYSGVSDYWDRCREAVREMHRQVGDLQVSSQPIGAGQTVSLATKGLLVRHLVMPNNIARTDKVLEFLANEISKDTYVNIMSQYRPEWQASRFPELNRRITHAEYVEAFRKAEQLGLHRFAD
ncbi:MAG: radical SAM protein [Armatimonadota bacterium]|nr:radical SAM protein [Armatimonadota bacterium]